MGLKKINAKNNTVIPAASEKTYNAWRLMQLNVRTERGGQNLGPRLNAMLQKGVQDIDGNWEMSPLPQDSVRLNIEDLNNDTEIQTYLNGLIDLIELRADSQGLL